jgi:hypothetical protein
MNYTMIHGSTNIKFQKRIKNKTLQTQERKKSDIKPTQVNRNKIRKKHSNLKNVTGRWTEKPWFDSRQNKNNFLFSEILKSVLGNSQVRIQWVSRCQVPLSGKEQGPEADHTTLANAQVKNEWIYTSTHVISWPAYKQQYFI